jgi:hypothetical protein
MRAVVVEWRSGPGVGFVEVSHGNCNGLTVERGAGSVDAPHFELADSGPCRLRIEIDGEDTSHGPTPTRVTIRTERAPFAFLLRDVNRLCPVFVPACQAVVLPADDPRSYAEVEESIRSKGLRTQRRQIAAEPEESFANAAAHTRNLRCPAWLGLGRDMRIFEIAYAHETPAHSIVPKFHGYPTPLPETAESPSQYSFYFSRGESCVESLTRRLDEGVLPILHATIADGGVVYNATAFASLEASPLTAETVRGTHYLVADKHGFGNMLTPEQEALYQERLPEEMNRDEEVVLYHRVEAVNTEKAPRYAWFKCPWPNAAHTFDGAAGLGLYETGRVFVAARLDGRPLPKEEVAVLLMPGEAAVFDFALPHRPIPRERAEALARQDFAARLDECRAYWRAKLDAAARVSVPEKRVDEMLRAGLLHLDLVAYGLEPDGPVAATIGVYCPIGSESSPIIQAMDSFGWSRLAERSLDYFLAKQHDDGFMQNFGGYMLETGAVLWSMGEHYRYTRDTAWVARVAPNVVRACEYLLAWRKRNLREELRGRGYGLIEGKVADPEDPFHAFMLNGYACIGMARAAEMLACVQPEAAAAWSKEAEQFRADIRAALRDAVAASPVVPLLDGTWSPSIPPWAEARGPVSLLTDGQPWFTHGAFTVRDSLIGPIYLVLQEILDPAEPMTDWLIDTHADLYHTRNVAPSQPYYSTHAYAHLLRGEVNAFLKTYYNGFAGLADRETYTFWEHYFHASPHKTHEEGWFLMQTRWMLWMERDDTLSLLPGIPRAWMEDGKQIVLDRVRTHFGPVSLNVTSRVQRNRIEVRIGGAADRAPKRVRIRVPHPQGRRAIAVGAGVYDASTETVTLDDFANGAEFDVRF